MDTLESAHRVVLCLITKCCVPELFPLSCLYPFTWPRVRGLESVQHVPVIRDGPLIKLRNPLLSCQAFGTVWMFFFPSQLLEAFPPFITQRGPLFPHHASYVVLFEALRVLVRSY